MGETPASGTTEANAANNVRALFAYTAQQDDELSFQEGQLIKLVSFPYDQWFQVVSIAIYYQIQQHWQYNFLY